VLAGVKLGGGEVEIVILSEAKNAILPCVGCDVCHESGKCPLKDNFEELKAKLLGCDGFIFASPNYIHSVSAQMKALFDRCCGIIHCAGLEGKYGVAVETSGGGEDDEVLDYLKRVIGTFGAQAVGGIGSSAPPLGPFPRQEALFATARELGLELCRCIEQKRHFPEQDAYLKAFKIRMQGLVEYRRNEWPFEYDYWQAKK
jgi:multimeric flavodoxin WrbA